MSEHSIPDETPTGKLTPLREDPLLGSALVWIFARPGFETFRCYPDVPSHWMAEVKFLDTSAAAGGHYRRETLMDLAKMLGWSGVTMEGN